MKKKINLKLSSLNIGILYKLENGNKIINKSKPFDPLLNISKNIEEIKNSLKANPQDILNFLYFNIDNIERILYDVDKIIYFDFDDKKNNFFLIINQDKIEIENKNEMVFLFYISLLIKYNINIVNFSYSISFINKINSINKNIDINTIYKKMLISKIILELINFYKSNQIFEEKNRQEEKDNLNEIEKESINIIEKYINYFKNIGLKINQKELKLKSIDLIYAEIINKLLKSKNFNLIYKIIEQLDLENINITNAMFNEIFSTLSSNESFINEYKLTKFDDLFESKKIDFYYILFKYLLKNPIYIYYIEFLNETRKNVIKIIHLDQNKLNGNNRLINNNFKDKIIYIIKFFTNSNYYVNKYIIENNNNNLNYNLNKTNEISQNRFDNSDKSSLLTKSVNFSKQSQSLDLTNSIYNDSNYNEEINNLSFDEENILTKINDTRAILENSEITLNINNSNEIEENKEHKENKQIEYQKMVYSKGTGIIYKKFKNYFSKEEEQKSLMDFSDNFLDNKKKLIEFLDKIKEIAENKFSFFSLKLLIKILLKEEEDTKNNDNCIKKINSEYKIEGQYYLEKRYQDKNILKNNNYEGFTSFTEEIIKLFQNKSTNNENWNESSIPIKSSNIGTSLYNNSKYIINTINKYNFICLKKVIGNHTDIAEKIMELNNGSFISDSYNELFIYDIDFNKSGYYTFKNYYNFFVDKDDIIIIQKNKFTFLNKINTNYKDIDTKFSCRNLLKLKDNKYILCDEKGLQFCMYDLRKNDSTYKLNKISFRGGIEITNEIIAITSNKILPNGKNILMFFNSASKSFMNEIEVENYSFTLSLNNCALMRIPNNDNCKILLFACKKYIKDDKNGILLLKLQLMEDSGKKFEKFYDTKNFEVYCFCPILEIENKSILEKKDKAKANETGYFLVGGFDLDKNEGLIKLYKVIYNDEIEKIEIIYIQDIIVKKKFGGKESRCFKGFKGPISCIIQSSTGDILVTCYDGNVYLFIEPNFYLLNEENEYYNNILKNNI